MPYVNLNGTEHYYELAGTGGDVPLVFVHGWCGSARYWSPMIEQYSSRVRCLSYDLRGFGRSVLTATASRDFSLEAYSRELVALLDHLEIERIDLNAHSMGASIGLAFANLYPQRVRRLILTCTGVFEYQALPFETFYLASNLVIAARPPWIVHFAQVRKAFQRRFVYRLLSDEWARLFVEDYVVASAEAARGTLYASIGKYATFEMPNAFRALQRPTLLLSGQFDRIIPAAGAKRACLVNPDLTLAVIPNTGHFPMLEAPQRYFELMDGFLSDRAIASEETAS